MPSLLEVNSIMKKVSKGKLTTINQLRGILAKKYKTTTACPIVTGIFVIIAARAAEEELKEGKRVTLYWKTIKSNGIINEKYPGGIATQKKILQLHRKNFSLLKYKAGHYKFLAIAGNFLEVIKPDRTLLNDKTNDLPQSIHVQSSGNIC